MLCRVILERGSLHTGRCGADIIWYIDAALQQMATSMEARLGLCCSSLSAESCLAVLSASKPLPASDSTQPSLPYCTMAPILLSIMASSANGHFPMSLLYYAPYNPSSMPEIAPHWCSIPSSVYVHEHVHTTEV